MSIRITESNDDALANFTIRKAEVDALLVRFRDASHNNFNAKLDGIHWGHVGSLTYAAEKLREIASFLNV